MVRIFFSPQPFATVKIKDSSYIIFTEIITSTRPPKLRLLCRLIQEGYDDCWNFFFRPLYNIGIGADVVTLFYNTAEASLSLTDVSEIPDDAELAETFYSQFEDDFENDDSEDEVEDEDDLSALIGQMNDALEQTESHDQKLSEGDLPSEGFTDTWRYKRIEALKAYPF